MKKTQRIASFLMAAALLISATACTTGGNASSANPASAGGASQAASSMAEPAAPAELTWLVVGDNTPPDTNSVLKAIEEKTNTKIKITYVSAGDSAAKLNAFIAAKTLPDLFRVGTLSDADQLKSNGMVSDLTEFVKDAPNIQANLGDVIADHPLNRDGKIYAIFCADTKYGQNLCVRTDWLKNVGMEMPTDLDSLYNVLKAFTEKDPDGNGKNDTIGLGVSVVATWNNICSLMGSFNVPANASGFKAYLTEDGTVTTGMKNPGFLEGVKYFQKLYKDGLMEPDFATVPQMDEFGKLWNGKVGVFDFQCPGPTNNWMPSRYTENPPPTFDFAEIKGPSGVAAQAKQYPQYTPTYLVSGTCKDPAAAVRVMDFLMSEEGAITTFLGVEGTHFEWVDKTAHTYKMIPPYDDSATNRNDGVYVYSDYLKPKTTGEMMVMNQQTRDGVAMAYNQCTIEWPFIYTVFPEDATYAENLKTIEKEVFCQLVSTKGDIDKEYQEAIARWEAEGGLEWEAGATAAYNSQK